MCFPLYLSCTHVWKYGRWPRMVLCPQNPVVSKQNSCSCLIMYLRERWRKSQTNIIYIPFQRVQPQELYFVWWFVIILPECSVQKGEDPCFDFVHK